MRVGWGGHVAEGGSRHGTAERGRKRVSKRRMGSPCCPSPPTHTHIARQHALQDIGSVQAVNAVGAHHPLRLLAHDTAGIVQEVGVAIHIGGDLRRKIGVGGAEDGVS